MTPNSDLVYLVDASVYVFRAYYSVDADMHDRDGYPTHAAYGFAGFLCTLLQRVRPDRVAVCFDEALDSSFRNDIYPEYKANRESPPPDLKRQFVHCRAIADALGLAAFSHEHYEADDLIGTLALRARDEGSAFCVVTADKDLTQLLGPDDLWWDFSRQRHLAYDDVAERFGVRPEQIADYLALTGDAVDNIPGVPGVGPKSAAALLSHFGDIATLCERIDEVEFLRLRGARRIMQSVRDALETLHVSRRLTQIACDAPLGPFAPELQRSEVDAAALHELFDYLNFGRLLRERCLACCPSAAASHA